MAVEASGVLRLRPYQADAMEAVRAAWDRGMMRPAVVLPTGAGKTVVFAHLISTWLGLNRGRRCLVLAHRTELIEQAADKLHDVAPHLRIGIVKANQNETLAEVIVGSVQTLKSENRRRMLRDVGMIVVDECHHATAESYRAVIGHFAGALVVGFTATMTRSDEANLGDIWDDVVYMRSIAEMIAMGFLVRPRGIRVYVDSLDMGAVRKSGKDYREADLGRAIEGSLAPEAIAEAIREHAAERQTIVFAPTVASAMVIESAIAAEGFKTGLVYGELAAGVRRGVLEEFRSGGIQVVVNCMVLTEGTDLPMCSCIVIARPTLHSGLYIQMAGRGLRLFPGKDSCLILDVVGASQKHGLIAPVELFGEEQKAREAKEDDTEQVLEEDIFDGEGIGRDVGEDYVAGPLSHAEVDLFHGSTSAWMQTYGGIWFLAAGERYIAILPGSKVGTYDVAAMHKSQRGTGRWVIEGVKDMSWAMAWAEGDVSASELTLARKDSKWRAKKPNEKQIALAKRLGRTIKPEMLSGEVSRLITEAIASSRIDPPILQAMGRK
jgi:superfamily II DNA or RNA helicase